MRRALRRVAIAVAALLLPRVVLATDVALPAALPGGHVNVAVVSGTINPASADHLISAVRQSESDGAAALLVELDTPGGLLASTKDVIQAFLNARVPVLVWVGPAGAWAGSAGTFITLAAHVAAMAPGTSIGAAHPVGVGTPGTTPDEKGGGRDFAAEKAENFTAAFIESIARERHRNAEWAVKAVRESVAVTQDEALKLGVIELVAANRAELLRALEGREIVIGGTKHVLALASAETRVLEMTLLARFLDALASPNVAVMLLMAGLVGLYIEFTTPGVIVPGVVGAGCLLLGTFALQMLPFSWFGLALMLAGIACFVAELYVVSHGLLVALGAACFLLGGSRLVEPGATLDLVVSFWSVLVPVVVAVALLALMAAVAVGRSLALPSQAGVGELIGHAAKAVSALAPEGSVFVRGEYWTAVSEAPVEAGASVEVIAVEGLRLRVRPLASSGTARVS